MAALIIDWLVIYGWCGGAVAVVFLLFGIDRVDAGARGAYAFRAAILPGVIALWPVVLIRWAQLELRGRGRSPLSAPED
ncbi:MAG: hypothetical protein AAFR16_09465 [Pseudomonadota bacterium]